MNEPLGVLDALASRKVSLELGTLDLCFLAMLHVRAEDASVPAFGEEALLEIFEDVCARVEPSAEQRRKRATHTIARLREPRLLARVDGAGVLRAGEYALTRLASGIVEFYLSEDALTRESLSVLTESLLKTLRDVKSAAERASEDTDFERDVVGPLAITVGDLAAGIERRQRGMDLQQERLQREIADLLAADWFGAIARCQNLLETTSATLRELREVLLSGTHRLHALLQDIQDLALAKQHAGTELAVQRVVEQLDRIAAWGSAREHAWSEYYQYVHRYLRDVVRLDPSRALSERLREQMIGKGARAFALTVAQSEPLHLLREAVVPPPHVPVKRPKAPREKPPGDVEVEDREAALEDRVREILGSGATRLSQLTEQVADTVAVKERFVTAGRVAEIVARVGQTASERERPWRPIQDDIVIEEWHVTEKESAK